MEVQEAKKGPEEGGDTALKGKRRAQNIHDMEIEGKWELKVYVGMDNEMR